MRHYSIAVTALSIRLSPMTALFRLHAYFSLCVQECMYSVSVPVCHTSVHQQSMRGLGGVWIELSFILSCISTRTGLGHINILINMQESITEEARA